MHLIALASRLISGRGSTRQQTYSSLQGKMIILLPRIQCRVNRRIIIGISISIIITKNAGRQNETCEDDEIKGLSLIQ